MVLILSSSRDYTTYLVVKWLQCHGKQVEVISDEDEITAVSIQGKATAIVVEGRRIDFDTVESYWYRRTDFAFPISSALPQPLSQNLQIEISMLKQILHNRLAQIRHLSSFFNSDLNRVNVLMAAKERGFAIPGFGVFTRKTDLIAFSQEHTQVIVKPLWNGLNLTDENILYTNYSELLSCNDLNVLPETFFPTLVLQYVNKKYELRIVYLDGECYTMAILSQNDPQTFVDYRKYNIEKPNRNVPYALPEGIAQQLTLLMKDLRLKTASIDMIVTPEGDFTFLEVNPIGQFLNVSQLCNYHLEKRIAEYLV